MRPFITLLLGLSCIVSYAQKAVVNVQNPLPLNRRDLVEIPVSQLKAKAGWGQMPSIIVRDADGVEVPYQVTHDGLLLVQSLVRPSETTTFSIEQGTPQPCCGKVVGRVRPDRLDDLAWENDRNGWRLYGPGMRKGGAYGIDCFAKNRPEPVLDSLYRNDLVHHVSYHVNHGMGMDAYTVGPTLGAGAPALMMGDSLLFANVYDQVEILDNGPLRFTARLVYRHSDGIRETRLIQQDCGSHLVRCTVSYQGENVPDRLATGLVVHADNPREFVINRQGRYIAYADNVGDPNTRNGQLFTACLYPGAKGRMRYLPMAQEKSRAVGHVLTVVPYRAGEPFTYYFGSGWSQYDVPSMPVWETLLHDYQQQILHPLEISL